MIDIGGRGIREFTMFGRIALMAAALAMFGAGVASAEVRCGASTHERFGEKRAYFRDVLGACRPDGYCSAVVALTDDGGAQYRQQLRVARTVAGAPYQVEFVAVSPMPTPEPTPTSLAFGQRTIDLGSALAQTQSMNEFRVSAQNLTDDIVANLKAARQAQWTYQSVAGPSTAVFPLNGMTAVLAWIDCMGNPAD